MKDDEKRRKSVVDKIFKNGQMTSIQAILSSRYHSIQLNQYPVSLASHVVLYWLSAYPGKVGTIQALLDVKKEALVEADC